MPGHKQSGGSHKMKRNKVKCDRYTHEGRRDKNKARRAAKRARRLARAKEKREGRYDPQPAAELESEIVRDAVTERVFDELA